jgi:hypothetical protein
MLRQTMFLRSSWGLKVGQVGRELWVEEKWVKAEEEGGGR